MHLISALLRNTRRIKLALILVVLLIGVAPGVSIIAAQTGTPDDPYRSEVLGWDIVVTGPEYVLETVALEEYPHGRGERVYITQVDSLAFVEVSFFDDDDTPEETIEIMLRDFRSASESLDVIDSGIVDGIHYAFARFDLGQSLYGYFYIEVAQDIDGNVDLAQSIYSVNSDFLEQIEIAREEISFNDFPYLSEPVVDLKSLVTADEALLASTPEPIATPDIGTFTFETNNTELVVDDPIEFDFPLTSGELEVMFLSSSYGYGIVGYIHQQAETAESVLGSVFIGAPTGAEAPVELHLEANADHAQAVYRIQTQGEVRAMLIEIVYVDEELWQVQAIAVTESEFAQELEGYQRGVRFDGTPFLDNIDPENIVTILNEN